jgi:putative lipoprotein
MKSARVVSSLAVTFLLSLGSGARAQTTPQTGAAALAGTSWRLVKFEGGDGTTLTPDDRSKYTVTFAADGRVSARVDCNRGAGTWTSSGPNQLQFGPLALTRAMCPPVPLNDRITKDWQYVRSYTMKDGHLFLSLMADGGIYEFEPSGGSQSAALESPVASKGPVEYDCAQAGGGSEKLRTTFYQTTPAMVLVERGNQTRPAFQVPAASGAKYQGQDLMFWDAHDEALVAWSGAKLNCKPYAIESIVAAGQVKGTATYRERMALSPNAVFEATLEDVSRADAPAEVIARSRIEHPANPPIPFEITYDPSRIIPSHRYAVRARILVDGKLFFTTDQHYPVFTAGQSNAVALLLRRASESTPVGGNAESPANQPPSSVSAEPLENTYWKLTSLGDTPIRMASQQQEPHLVLNSESHRVNGSGGCNQLMGSYELKGDQLTFSQMAGTMSACLEGMETEKAFLDVLKQVNRWKVNGQQLELFDATCNLLASFEAYHLK